MTPRQGLPSLLCFLQLQPTRLCVSLPGSMPLVCHVPIFICICIVWLLLCSLIPPSLLILSTGSFDPLLMLCSFRLTSGERTYSSPLVALWSHLLSLFPVCFYPPPASDSREAFFRKTPREVVFLFCWPLCAQPQPSPVSTLFLLHFLWQLLLLIWFLFRDTYRRAFVTTDH